MHVTSGFASGGDGRLGGSAATIQPQSRARQGQTRRRRTDSRAPGSRTEPAVDSRGDKYAQTIHGIDAGEGPESLNKAYVTPPRPSLTAPPEPSHLCGSL